MIRKYLGVNQVKIEDDIIERFKYIDYGGRVIVPLVTDIYNVLLWEYIGGGYNDDSDVLVGILKRMDLFIGMGDSLLLDRSIFIYVLLSKEYDLVALNMGELSEDIRNNKFLEFESFGSPILLDAYLKSPGEISAEFMLFEQLLVPTGVRVNRYNKTIGEVVKTRRVSDMLCESYWEYKLATKSLPVRSVDVVIESKDKSVMVLQDCSGSMNVYRKHTLAAKAFIIDRVLSKGLYVDWWYVADKVYAKERYDSPRELEVYNGGKGAFIDLQEVLQGVELKNKHIIIITDGTDDFKVPDNVVTSKIHLVYYEYNAILINKFANYGKSYKLS
ncbi:MAG: hypothetical protein KAH32_01795 [Chlamydiia bacterium]|nr:hypothetical protein [Chlamydiia bacterium]